MHPDEMILSLNIIQTIHIAYILLLIYSLYKLLKCHIPASNKILWSIIMVLLPIGGIAIFFILKKRGKLK